MFVMCDALSCSGQSCSLCREGDRCVIIMRQMFKVHKHTHLSCHTAAQTNLTVALPALGPLLVRGCPTIRLCSASGDELQHDCRRQLVVRLAPTLDSLEDMNRIPRPGWLVRGRWRHRCRCPRQRQRLCERVDEPSRGRDVLFFSTTTPAKLLPPLGSSGSQRKTDDTPPS